MKPKATAKAPEKPKPKLKASASSKNNPGVKKKGNPENLVPFQARTADEHRKIATQGGIKSGESRREKILMSNILTDYLMETHDLIIKDDQGKVIDRSKISAKQLIKKTITGIMSREDSASVAMIKTLGEITEGNKLQLTGGISVNITPLDEAL